MKGENGMTKLTTVGGRRTVEITQFGSLDRQSPICGGAQAWVLRNLRPLEDGSLVRREGFSPVLTTEGEIRGVFFTERGGVQEGYAVFGETVCFLKEEDGGYAPITLGTLTTQVGRVHVLRHDGCVVLMDGVAAYTLTPEGMEELRAYAPLYGKDWDPTRSAPRPMHETPNLLTRQLRFRFVHQTDGVLGLYMNDLAVESVDGLLADGVPTTKWRFEKDNNCVWLERIFEIGTVFEVLVTMKPSFFETRTDGPLGAESVAVIGDAERASLLFFGGSVPTGKVWMSRAVDDEARDTHAKLSSDYCCVYVTAEDMITVGDGVQSITGACRHYDRSLIFTADQTWMADGSLGESGRLRLIPINNTLGCDRLDGCAVVGNHPYTFHRGRVLRWNSRTDERDECNAEVVSLALGDKLDRAAARLFADVSMRELWVFVPGRDGVLVMRGDGAWTVFDGFSPDGMVMIGDAVGFYEGRTLYRFDADSLCDVDGTGQARAIEVEYQSRYMDFGQAHRVKRLCGVTLLAACGDGSIELAVEDVRGRVSRETLRGTGDEVSVLTTRAHSGRFRYLRIHLFGRESGRLRLCGLAATARGASQ